MMRFIDQYRPLHRVESICAALSSLGCQVAPRTYRSWRARPPAARTLTDAHLTDALRATACQPERLYGRRKMTALLRRQGHQVAACTVDRLMRDEHMSGVLRRVDPSQRRRVARRIQPIVATPRRWECLWAGLRVG
jgi:putative transposase